MVRSIPFADDEDEDVADKSNSARAARPSQAQIHLPPDGRGSSQRHQAHQPPARPNVRGTRDPDGSDAKSAGSSDEQDWIPEEQHSEALMQIRFDYQKFSLDAGSRLIHCNPGVTT